MENADIETEQVTYRAHERRTEFGHSHSGEAHRAVQSITRVFVEANRVDA
ncbi:hypothetical protein [Haloarchaeobius sp. DFWS5]